MSLGWRRIENYLFSKARHPVWIFAKLSDHLRAELFLACQASNSTTFERVRPTIVTDGGYALAWIDLNEVHNHDAGKASIADEFIVPVQGTHRYHPTARIAPCRIDAR